MGNRVVIIGVNGFIGRELATHLISRGFDIVGTSRYPQRAAPYHDPAIHLVHWDGRSPQEIASHIDGARAVVNLAGETLAGWRWSTLKKKRILDSRVQAGLALGEAVESLAQGLEVLIQASAVGFYGNRADEVLAESSARGEGFLSRVTEQWEAASFGVEAGGVRRVVLRIAMVLGRGGGALPRLILPFRLFLGGELGNGKQWMSWIHIRDLVDAISFLLERSDLQGIFNIAAPGPVRNRDFSRSIAGIIRRPSWFRIPAFVLRLIMGEVAREMLLVSQQVAPRRLQQAGFSFRFPCLQEALKDLL